MHCGATAGACTRRRACCRRRRGPATDAAELGVQDLVVIAVKGPALAQVARGIAPLLGPKTLVLPAMNGVPWWFCQGLAGFPGGALQSVDPGGAIGARHSLRRRCSAASCMPAPPRPSRAWCSTRWARG